MTTLQADEPTDAPAALAPPPGNPRFPLLDALRAIAALAVLVYHAGAATASGGPVIGRLDAGVTLFFLVSGFLLYRPWVAHRVLAAPRTRLRDYARRRALRILPAYWLALTVLAIWPGLPGVFTGRFWVFYGFGQIYSDTSVLQGIGPAWTLCVEVSFYAALPLWAGATGLLLRSRPARVQRDAELALLALLAAASLALRWYLAARAPFSPVQNTLAVYLDWFAVGMAFAVGSVARDARDAPTGRDARTAPGRSGTASAAFAWLSWAGGILALLAAALLLGGPHRLVIGGHVVLLFTVGENLGIHLLDALAAAGLLAPAVLGSRAVRPGEAPAARGDGVRALLAARPLALLGLISYGIYLWQEPLLNRACTFRGFGVACGLHGPGVLDRAPLPALCVLTLVPTLLLAGASYRWVERPLLRLKDRRGAGRR